jgi:hypothetical protein
MATGGAAGGGGALPDGASVGGGGIIEGDISAGASGADGSARICAWTSADIATLKVSASAPA